MRSSIRKICSTIAVMMSGASLGTAFGGEAQPSSAGSGMQVQMITLDDALDLALANNLALATDSYSRRTTREQSIIAKAAYEPVISVTARKSIRQRESDVANPYDGSFNDTLTTSASVSQTIDTGADITLSTNGARSFQNRLGTTFNPEYNAGVAISINQPLLNGGGITVNRAQRRQALLAVARNDLNFRAQVLNVVQNVEIAFFDLASAHEELAVRQSAVVAAQRLVSENEARQNAGLATELDSMQARVGLANSQAQLIQAEQALQSASDDLLALLGYSNFDGTLQPTAVDYSRPPVVTVGEAYGRARENDPALLAAQTALLELELSTRVARNARLPQLNLNGSLGYDGSDASYQNAADKITEGSAYSWQLGLTLNVPWGLRANKARHRIAAYNEEAQRATIAEIEQSLLVNVRSAVRAIDTSIRSVEIAELSTELSAREYELEKARFDSGLSTSRLVVEAQQRGDEQKVAETQSRVQLKQNEARLRRIEGTSLDRFDLEVPPIEE